MKRALALTTRYVWYAAVILLNLCGCQENVGGPVTCTTGDGTCGSRRCVDGYCCDSACDGTCQACNLPGHEGNCMDLADGEDPAGECGECRVCGGQGACRDVPAGDDPKDDCDQWDPSTCGLTGDCDGAGRCANYGSDTPCDDQELCTYDDHCDGQGSCSGTGITCEPDPDPCAFQPVCNGTDTCEEAYPGHNTSCDDQDLCTHDDRCDGQGGCAGAAIACDDDPGPCGAKRECNGTDTCTLSYSGSETACQDDDLCTYDDRCDGQGSCTGTEIICQDDPGPCGALRDCNGTDTCTVSYPPAGIACDEGRFCTVGDQCDGVGSCIPGTSTPCQAGEICYENEDRCCQPSAYTACGAYNDVYWFDSCDHRGGIHENCPDPNGECSNGACDCKNHWTGADCLTCPGHWDPAQDCNACQGNWDPDRDCNVCLPDHIGMDCELEQCVRYVNLDSTAVNLDGRTWQGAFISVQEGLDAAYNAVLTDPATDDCHVWVARGVYYIYQDGRDDTVQLRPDVLIYGGFVGGERALEQRDWETNITVLDGHESTAGANQVYHVVTASDAQIDGFKITGGNAAGPIRDEQIGGGMFARGVSPTVVNCTFTGNSATGSDGGGGLYFENSSPVVDNCVVSNNTSSGNGGGISLWYSTGAIFSGTTVEGNHADVDGGGVYLTWDTDTTLDDCQVADNTSGGAGAGLASWSSTNASISNSTFTLNQTGSNGGGVYISGDIPPALNTVLNCQITENSAGTGGGIYSSHSNPVVVDSDVIGNNALDGDGGGVALMDASARVEGCTIADSTTPWQGAGIVCISCDAQIAGTEIRGNVSGDAGAGIHITGDSTTTVERCDIHGNHAYNHGGGISCWGSATQVVIDSSEIYLNTAEGGGGGIHIEDSAPTVQNCNIRSNDSTAFGGGVNCFMASPVFVNNTIVGNQSPGGNGLIASQGTVLTLLNTILFNGGATEVSASEWGPLNTISISYSDVQGGQSSIVTNGNATVNWLAGNINADPLFANAPAGDYHLSLGSPCIDAGTATNAPVTDFEGDGRPWGSGYDIGADEYTSAP